MAGSRDKQHLTPADISELAGTLKHFHERYEMLAKRMTENGVATIYAGNIKLLKRGLTHVSKAINAAFSAYDTALTERGPLGSTDAAGKKLGRKMARDAKKALPKQ